MDIDNLIKAPHINHKRVKILWDNDNLQDYQTTVCSELSRIRKQWSNSGSSVSVAILLDLTNKVLSESATATQKYVPIHTTKSPKNMKVAKEVAIAKAALNKAHKALKKVAKDNTSSFESLTANLKIKRRNYRSVTRRKIHEENLRRDSELFSIFSPRTTNLFRKIRSSKSSAAGSISFLTVGDKTYPSDMI